MLEPTLSKVNFTDLVALTSSGEFIEIKIVVHELIVGVDVNV